MAELESRVHKQWQELCASCDISDSTLVEEWWKVLLEHYTERWRHYHTLQHVEDLLQLMEKEKGNLRDPTAVGLAIFFHDVIYQPRLNDNEEKSAALFKQFALKTKLETKHPELVSSIAHWILVTMNHSTTEHAQEAPEVTDLHYFLDFDMAVLGRSSVLYSIYAGQIQKEYIHYSVGEYRRKRTLALQHFLSRPYIYVTPEFRKQLEKVARNNLTDEINKHTHGGVVKY